MVEKMILQFWAVPSVIGATQNANQLKTEYIQKKKLEKN